MKMVKTALRANEEAERFRENYITGIDFATASLLQAIFAQAPKAKKAKKK